MKYIRKNDVVIRQVGDQDIHEEYSVGKSANLTLVLIACSTRDVAITLSVHLAGAGAHATVLGIVLGRKSGSVAIRTLQHHQSPNTTSNLLIKSVMTDMSSCVYEGSIIVDKPAQKTDAYQRNENLLLDDRAHATSKPALEILANDVRCTHGAVVKTLNRDELWYAATRGIGEESARRMITRGFLVSTFSTVADTIMREELEHAVDALLF